MVQIDRLTQKVTEVSFPPGSERCGREGRNRRIKVRQDAPFAKSIDRDYPLVFEDFTEWWRGECMFTIRGLSTRGLSWPALDRGARVSFSCVCRLRRLWNELRGF